MELVMPMNYEVLDQEEMMYLDGGRSFRINKAVLHGALMFVGGKIISELAGASLAKVASVIASKAIPIAKAIILKGTFGSFVTVALTSALAGILVVTALYAGAVWLGNKAGYNIKL
ncbi:hypothetical protein ERUR111494_04710 [Erysipelothrix urinaevulpis]|uniref:hypothetical protein n=1 Tax=Erysipelothrix urinaevulpis TaxID=2683717 RepID=UPI001358C2D7|nr:hypothetical protein [Erysipelothrix urinaevulpis]